jgi:large subunit ribosomal protein L25
MADRIALAAQPRTVLGKRVKRLRSEGTLPANVYGRGIESVALQLDAREFGRTIKASGVRHLFDLQVDGEPRVRPVVIRGLSRKGGTGDVTHVDFYQVDPNRPITATLPIHLQGEAPAVRDLAGTLVQNLDQVAVRTLPLTMPEFLAADATKLARFDISLTVADLEAADGVEVLTDPAVVIATVSPPRLRVEGEEEAAPAQEAPAEDTENG